MNSATDLLTELTFLVNKYSLENKVDMPDMIIAEYLLGCFHSLEFAVKTNMEWHRDPNIPQEEKKYFGVKS